MKYFFEMKDFFVVSCHVFQHLPSANTILIFYIAKNLIAIKKLHLTEVQNPHKAPHGHCSVINFSCPVFFTARKRSLGQGNIFRSVCQEFCPRGACVVAGGMHGCRGHAWLWGACVVVGACVVAGGMHGCGGGVVGVRGCGGHVWLWGACMVVGSIHGCGGYAWLQGVCGYRGHAWCGGCAWLWGGMCGCRGHASLWGGHAWDTMRYGQ